MALTHVNNFSFVEPNNVWVSDISNNLIFTNTKCKNIHHVNHIGRGHGIHTVNSDNELIYIDNANNIKKLSSDTKTTTTFVEATHPQWRKTCVFWSKTTEDLLVGMDIYRMKKANKANKGRAIFCAVRLSGTTKLEKKLKQSNSTKDSHYLNSLFI